MEYINVHNVSIVVWSVILIGFILLFCYAFLESRRRKKHYDNMYDDTKKRNTSALAAIDLFEKDLEILINHVASTTPVLPVADLAIVSGWLRSKLKHTDIRYSLESSPDFLTISIQHYMLVNVEGGPIPESTRTYLLPAGLLTRAALTKDSPVDLSYLLQGRTFIYPKFDGAAQ